MWKLLPVPFQWLLEGIFESLWREKQLGVSLTSRHNDSALRFGILRMHFRTTSVTPSPHLERRILKLSELLPFDTITHVSDYIQVRWISSLWQNPSTINSKYRRNTLGHMGQWLVSNEHHSPTLGRIFVLNCHCSAALLTHYRACALLMQTTAHTIILFECFIYRITQDSWDLVGTCCWASLYEISNLRFT